MLVAGFKLARVYIVKDVRLDLLGLARLLHSPAQLC
jgi:hypothetical protein